MKLVYRTAVLAGLIVAVFTIVTVDDIVKDPDIHSSTFFAYGRIFVEFKQGHSVWGALLLDGSGSPISCKENNAIQEDTISKGSV